MKTKPKKKTKEEIIKKLAKQFNVNKSQVGYSFIEQAIFDAQKGQRKKDLGEFIEIALKDLDIADLNGEFKEIIDVKKWLFKKLKNLK